MIRTKLSQQNIERHRFRALIVQFLDEMPINVTRPVEARAVAKAPAQQLGNGFVVDERKAKIGRTGTRIIRGQAHSPIVSHPLQTLKNIKTLVTPGEDLQHGHERDHGNAERNQNEFVRLDLHTTVSLGSGQ